MVNTQFTHNDLHDSHFTLCSSILWSFRGRFRRITHADRSHSAAFCGVTTAGIVNSAHCAVPVFSALKRTLYGHAQSALLRFLYMTCPRGAFSVYAVLASLCAKGVWRACRPKTRSSDNAAVREGARRDHPSNCHNAKQEAKEKLKLHIHPPEILLIHCLLSPSSGFRPESHNSIKCAYGFRSEVFAPSARNHSCSSRSTLYL
jgi:hypothetical protein